MKKIVLTMAVLFTVALASCTNAKKSEAVDTDTTIEAVTDTTVAADTDTVATVAVENDSAYE